MVRKDDFDRGVRLPPGLDVTAIRKAIEYIERELADGIRDAAKKLRRKAVYLRKERDPSWR
ncbi:MAG: hypothetical protein ACYTFA_05895 [Planctomycetota bacterium]|jgi:hypothetical protein